MRRGAVAGPRRQRRRSQPCGLLPAGRRSAPASALFAGATPALERNLCRGPSAAGGLGGAGPAACSRLGAGPAGSSLAAVCSRVPQCGTAGRGRHFAQAPAPAHGAPHAGGPSGCVYANAGGMPYHAHGRQARHLHGEAPLSAASGQPGRASAFSASGRFSGQSDRYAVRRRRYCGRRIRSCTRPVRGHRPSIFLSAARTRLFRP